MSISYYYGDTKGKLVQEYFARWELNKLTEMKNSFRTPAFYPLPNVDLKFCFECWFQYAENDVYVSVFRVSFLKLFESKISPNLKLNINLTVLYQDKTVFQEYSSTGLSVNEISCIKCIDNVSKTHNYSRAFEARVTSRDFFINHHGMRLLNHDRLTLKCNLFFYFDDDSDRYDLSSLCKFKKMTQYFKDIYASNTLSDIEVKIGNETLSAHRLVLAAQSPALEKMIIAAEELKTNTISITDCDPEIFKIVMEYMYTGDLSSDSLDNLKKLYAMSDRLDIKLLKEAITLFIVNNRLDVSTVWEVFKMAYDNNDEILKREVKKFISINHNTLSSTTEWKQCIVSSPKIAYEIMAYISCVTIEP